MWKKKMWQRDSLFSSVRVSPSFLRAADFSSSSCTVTSLWLTDDSFWISSTDFSRSLRQEWTEGWTPSIPLPFIPSPLLTVYLNYAFYIWVKSSASRLPLKPLAALPTVLDSWTGGVWTDIYKFHATAEGRRAAEETNRNMSLFSWYWALVSSCSDSCQTNLPSVLERIKVPRIINQNNWPLARLCSTHWLAEII